MAFTDVVEIDFADSSCTATDRQPFIWCGVGRSESGMGGSLLRSASYLLVGTFWIVSLCWLSLARLFAILQGTESNLECVQLYRGQVATGREHVCIASLLRLRLERSEYRRFRVPLLAADARIPVTTRLTGSHVRLVLNLKLLHLFIESN